MINNGGHIINYVNFNQRREQNTYKTSLELGTHNTGSNERTIHPRKTGE